MSAVEVLRSRPWEAFSFGSYWSLALGQRCSEGQGRGRRIETWPLRRLDGGGGAWSTDVPPSLPAPAGPLSPHVRPCQLRL